MAKVVSCFQYIISYLGMALEVDSASLGGLGEDENLNRLARVVNTARRQWNLNPGSLCLRSTRVETVLNLTILSCVSWDAWKWRMTRFPAGWGSWLLDLTISDLETEMNVWAVQWDVVVLPTKGGYLSSCALWQGRGWFKLNNSGNAYVCSTLLHVLGALKMCVNWGNKVKAHKTVCLAVWGWRCDKMVK